MRKAIINATLAGLLLCGATVASAQNTAQGRAFGMTFDVGGTNVITQSDTGTRNAPNPANTPNPNGFDVTAAGATVPGAPLIEAVTGPSRTRGCASPSACPELFATPSATDPLDPSLSNGVIVGRIARSADPAGTQDQTGNGRINMPRALADTMTEPVQPAGAQPGG